MNGRRGRIDAVYGNAASRLSQVVPAGGAHAYGSDSDVEVRHRQQARETDRKKREQTLHQIQRLIHERVRFAPIYNDIWPSGIGPRVEEPALMLIDPTPTPGRRRSMRSACASADGHRQRGRRRSTSLAAAEAFAAAGALSAAGALDNDGEGTYRSPHWPDRR